MWDISESGAKPVEQVVVADDAMAWWPFPFYRGGGLYMRLPESPWLELVEPRSTEPRQLNRKLRTFSSRAERAWVICMHEWDAARACALWLRKLS